MPVFAWLRQNETAARAQIWVTPHVMRDSFRVSDNLKLRRVSSLALSLYRTTLLQPTINPTWPFFIKQRQHLSLAQVRRQGLVLSNPGYFWQTWLGFCNLVLALLSARCSLYVFSRTALATFAQAISWTTSAVPTVHWVHLNTLAGSVSLKLRTQSLLQHVCFLRKTCLLFCNSPRYFFSITDEVRVRNIPSIGLAANALPNNLL